jgi:hypothetical protein
VPGEGFDRSRVQTWSDSTLLPRRRGAAEPPASPSQEIPVENPLFRTDTSIVSEKGKPVVRRGRKATEPSGSAGLPNERENKMIKAKTLDGVRWLVLAALPSRVRAHGAAVDWLLDDPVFAPRGRRVERGVQTRLGSAVTARS